MSVLSKDLQDFQGKTLVSLFDDVVRKQPDSIALYGEVENVTYSMLDSSSNRLARYLFTKGVCFGDRVGICLPRSVEAIVTLLAILKAGAAYVPIGSAWPAARQKLALDEAEARFVFVDAGNEAALQNLGTQTLCYSELRSLIDEIDDEQLEQPIDSESLAWVLFTSGSTGKPKGVMGSHRACLTRLHALWEKQPFVEGERGFQHTSLTTVDSYWEIFGPLCAGNGLQIISEETVSRPELLLPYLAELPIYRICLVPSLLSLVLDIFPNLSFTAPKLTLWVTSGEALSVSLCQSFYVASPQAILYNQYGLTESCADISQFDTRSLAQVNWSGNSSKLFVPMGKMFAGTGFQIVDDNMKPVQAGTAGELCLYGKSLFSGYLNRADLDAERHCEISVEGEMVLALRTGDQVVELIDGSLLHVGRIDGQLNVRGYRIEPAEIEATLESHEAVNRAAVILANAGDSNQRLLAFITLRADCEQSDELERIDTIRAHASRQLPPYMLPSEYVTLGSMPRTSTGKIDRVALSSVAAARQEPDVSSFDSPAGPTEQAVADLFAEILGNHPISANKSFFALGGNSLLAMKLVAHLRRQFGVSLSLGAFFEFPTVQRLADHLDQERDQDRPETLPVPGRCHGNAELAVSYNQEGLWFLQQLGYADDAYTISWFADLKGDLDIAALGQAFREVLQRHEPLRMVFREQDGELVQVIQEILDTPFALVSISQQDLEPELNKLAAKQFDLKVGPLYEFKLFRLDARHHCLAIAIHHIVFDGWSVDLFAQEIANLYTVFAEGRSPAIIPPAQLRYVDYATWQRRMWDEGLLEHQLNYWVSELHEIPAALELPSDRPRLPVAQYNAVRLPISLSAELTSCLRKLANQYESTLFMTLLAAFNVVLSRWTGQEKIVLGTPIAGRSQPGTENLVGYFANTLALCNDLSGDPSFAEHLKRVRTRTMGAFANQDVPFDKLVQTLQPTRDLSRHPIFQAMFALHPEPRAMEMPGVGVTAWEGAPRSAKFELAIEMVDADKLHGTLEYATELWDQETIVRFLGHFKNVLQAAVKLPAMRISELPMLGEAEYRLLTLDRNNTAVPYSHDSSIPELFERQAALTPQAAAVYFEGTVTTYQELDERAGRLANYLRDNGIGPDSIVALCVERSTEMMIGLLGILKAGAAYLPVDPDYPAERIAYMFTDSAVPMVLTQERLLSRLPSTSAKVIQLDRDWPQVMEQAPQVARRILDSRCLAYVIYTSGSTGRPKGVMISHRSILNHLTWMQRTHRLTVQDRVLQNAPISFDVSVWQLFWALLNGAAVVVTAPEQHRDINYIVDLVERSGVTVMHMVPSMLQVFVDTVPAERCVRVRDFIVGGEALSVSLQNRFLQKYRAKLHNQYGPTETSVEVTAHQCYPQQAHELCPIGVPLSNTSVYILDKHLALCPSGAIGELYISGVGLARGYLKRPELTAERFIPNPFVPGQRMYKTGDLTRWTAGGQIEYLGRIDHQVKIRGFRIEIGEIEAALQEHVAVDQALVVATSVGTEPAQLVAYVVCRAQSSATELGAHVRQFLPDYMTPRIFVFLEAFPLTPNGKIDRGALPAPQLAEDKLSIPPKTPLQHALADIFTRLLKVPTVGIYDDFFQVGGHSLLAMRVIAEVRTVLGLELPLRKFFEVPTIAALAEEVAHLDVVTNTAFGALTPRIRPRLLPLSYAQERLWFITQLGIGGAAYNVPWTLEMRGKVDATLLEKALSSIVVRHESLRTRFTAHEGKAVQWVDPATDITLPLLQVELGQLEREIRKMAGQVFDLERGPLYKFVLFQSGPDHFIFSVVAHHIICDGWSIDILAEEVCKLYSAFAESKQDPLPPIAAQYADYSLWQRDAATLQSLDRQAEFWRQRLEGVPALELPTDKVRPAIASYRGAHVPVVLNPAMTKALRELARNEGATVYMVLLTVFQVLLKRWSGQDDVVVGSPIAGRHQPETQQLIGFFVNTLALRADLSGSPSFSELLKQVRNGAIDAYAHQDVPFERLVDMLQPARDLSRHPIFQVMFALHTPEQSLQISGLALQAKEGHTPTAKFDLNLELTDSGDEIAGHFEFALDLWEERSIKRMAGHFLKLLEVVLAEPSVRITDAPMLQATEQHELLAAICDTGYQQKPPFTLHGRFETQANFSPDTVAVVCDDDFLTYRALNERANQLAHHLQGLGVGLESLVGLYLERGVDMITGILAILKAGGAYVPIDPNSPQERVAFLLSDAQPGVVITQSALLASLPAGDFMTVCVEGNSFAHEPRHNPASDVTPENLAYVIYTSGSTGKPKGALLEHASVARLFSATEHWFGFGANEVWTMFHSFAFDFSVWEIWGALLHGGKLVVVPYLVSRSPERFRALLANEGVTVLNQTPSAFQQLVDVETRMTDEALLPLRYVIFGGEALNIATLSPWFERYGNEKPSLINMYGITETTVHVTYYPVPGADSRANCVGRPIPDLHVYLLDQARNLVPVGIPGELYVAGPGLARGYLNREDLTEDRFVPNPYSAMPGSRMYKSGDMARYLENGDLEYLGRMDDQVKLRGFRIELGEIRTALSSLPNVRDTAVMLREDELGEKRLVAYLVPTDIEVLGNQADFITLCRSGLQSMLPTYMVPSAFVVLDQLPLTTNGKVNKKLLPTPNIGEQLRSAYVAPRSALERKLCEIWQSVLGVERIGVGDNFFALGGDSIRSVQIAHAANQAGWPITVVDLFQNQSISSLSSMLEKGKAGEPEYTIAAVVGEQMPSGDAGGAYPMSSMQQIMVGQYQAYAHTGRGVYHPQQSFHIRDQDYSFTALEKALRIVVAAHPILRTRFMVDHDDGPMQVVRDDIAFDIAQHDITKLREEEQEIFLSALMRNDLNNPFDVSSGEPLFRFALLKRSPTDFEFFMSIHHAIDDGWGNIVFLQQVFMLYREIKQSKAVALPLQPNVYREFIELERATAMSEKASAFWKRQEIPRTTLTKARRSISNQQYNSNYRFKLDTNTSTRIRELARFKNVTLKSVHLAAYFSLIEKINGTIHNTVGVVTNGRSEKLSDPFGALGLFWNMVPISAFTNAHSPLDSIATVHKALLDVEPYANYPMQEILDQNEDLFFASFNFINFHHEKSLWENTAMEVLAEKGRDNFHHPLNFTVAVNQDDQSTLVTVEFNPDYFAPEEIGQVGDAYVQMLQSMLAQSDGELVGTEGRLA